MDVKCHILWVSVYTRFVNSVGGYRLLSVSVGVSLNFFQMSLKEIAVCVYLMVSFMKRIPTVSMPMLLPQTFLDFAAGNHQLDYLG